MSTRVRDSVIIVQVEHGVEIGRPHSRAASLKVDANKFAPQGSNPNELRDKVKEIRKEYFTDQISAGPQSTVLEGVTWEEAQRIKEGQALGGIDNVRVTAASRGIIQREHQRGALFYKNYSLANPFDNVTKDDLEAYRREVERKEKRRAGGFMSADGELEDRGVIDTRPMSAPPPKLSFTVAPQTFPADVTGDSRDEVFRSETQEPATRTAGTHTLPMQSSTAVAADDKTKTLPAVTATADTDANLQRAHSARYPPEKRPETSETEGLQSPTSQTAGTSKEGSPSRDTSEGGTLPKDKKKKRGFRLPSFSKKKEK